MKTGNFGNENFRMFLFLQKVYTHVRLGILETSLYVYVYVVVEGM